MFDKKHIIEYIYQHYNWFKLNQNCLGKNKLIRRQMHLTDFARLQT